MWRFSTIDASRIEKGFKTVHTISVAEYDLPIASLPEYDAPPFALLLQFHTLGSHTHTLTHDPRYSV